ncbi:MAG TPA: amidohydrolase family protein [Pyrinomonadaceae bacterium]|jgi:predicted TIM-barrel fold metal-dependent hydrolase|nr:amidohydrolase family protein [Pyrinomonadaceae bacterium]
MKTFPLPLLLLVILAATTALAQTTADAQLEASIATIKAIDNHAHPLRYVTPGEKPDDEFDALPLDAIDPFPLPVRLNPANLEFVGAWRDLYGYKHGDMSTAHVRELLETKQRVAREQGERFPVWVLNQLNIETMFANRVAMGRGLDAARFRWVSFVDALIFPLNNEAAKRISPEYRGFYPNEEKLLRRYLADAGFKAPPATLDSYLAKVVTSTLESQKRSGAVAIKFEAAYLRKLDFDEADGNLARRVYSRYIRGGEPPAAEYKTLQDFIFRYIAREAGRLNLAVHIHAIGGAGAFYRQSGSNPMLLESVFNDPGLRKTNFVIIHGGYPFTKETASLLSKPNVYADFSGQTFLIYPRELSEVLRNWIEAFPDKILFGTDAFSFGPEVDWPEVAWLSNTSARQALALALTGMMNDREISRAQAIDLAKMALRDNAVKLYKLGEK